MVTDDANSKSNRPQSLEARAADERSNGEGSPHPLASMLSSWGVSKRDALRGASIAAGRYRKAAANG